MSVLERIATFQNRRDEAPNQELARQLAQTGDRSGIQEIADNLWHKNSRVQSDCVKVLYEIGYLAPDLIAGYAAEFIKLLRSRHNRLVWGGMIALSTIAGVAADELYPQRAEIIKAMRAGSVITIDAGVLTLATLAATGPERRVEIFPFLIKHLQTCRPKDVPQHAEKILLAADSTNREDLIRVLSRRLEDMSASQATRVKRVIRQAEKLGG